MAAIRGICLPVRSDQLGEARTDELGIRVQVDADELDPPVGKLAHIHRTGNAHQPIDGLDHLDFGVDEGVDMGGVVSRKCS